jgi:hypothetical protein
LSRKYEKIRKEELQTSRDPLLTRHRQRTLEFHVVEAAVFKWLQRIYPDRVFYEGGDEAVDYIIDNPDGTSIGVEIQLIRYPDNVGKLRRLSSRYTLSRCIEQGKYSTGLLVLVAKSSNDLARLNEEIDELDASNISITIGLINDTGEFEALRSTPYE